MARSGFALLMVVALCAAAPRPAHAQPSLLPVPPPGGLTVGVSGTSDPAALAAAQDFAVETVSMLVPETQTWLVYVPGAPGAVNTLTPATLGEDSIVTVLRAGVLSATDPGPQPPASSPPVTGGGNPLETPPPGGLVQGVAGTNDPATLAARQPFAVESVSTLDVPSQTWLIYVPASPPFVNTLRTGVLDESSIVTVRRTVVSLPSSPAPGPGASLTPSPTVSPDPGTSPTPSPTPSDMPVTGLLTVNGTAEAVMFASVNEERIAAGLAPLALDPELVTLARAHSRDMIRRDFFAHTNPDGDDPFDRMRAADVDFGWAAENIVSSKSGAGAHALLMGSPPHRANILGTRYQRVGIGAINRPGGGVMVTEMFAD